MILQDLTPILPCLMVLQNYEKQFHFDTRDAQRLFDDLEREFCSASDEFIKSMATNAKQQALIQQGIEELLASVPWYVKPIYRLSSYRRQERELLRQLRLKEDEANAIRITMVTLMMRYVELLENIWWPHWQRCLLTEHLEQEQNNLQKRLVGFINTIQGETLNRWSQCKSIANLDTQMYTGVLGREQLDILYAQILEDIPWSEYARLVLEYHPKSAIPGRTEHRRYDKCTDLSIHVRLDPHLLLERIEDYARYRFAPVRQLDVLDIMEVGGKATAGQFLSKASNKAKSYPEFSSGLFPAVENAGGLLRLQIVRCIPPIRDRLLMDYAHALGPGDRFIETQDSCRIEITTLTTGFPITLLHVFRNLGHVDS